MEKLRYYTRKSAWSAFKCKGFWLFFLVGVATFAAGFIVNKQVFDIKNTIQLAGLGVVAFSILILICKIISCVNHKLYFYDKKIVTRDGVFNRQVKSIAFLGVLRVDVEQSFVDRIFGLGNVYVDLFGKYDIRNEAKTFELKPLIDIAKPKKLQKFLDTRYPAETEVSRIIY